MNIAIVKYNAGNIYSVDYALKRLGVEATITSDKEMLMKADKVIFPGVGEAETTMNFLREQKLDLLIKDLKQPVLGICLGMQLLFDRSTEYGDHKGLGFVSGEVVDLREDLVDKTLKVPHMGWNSLQIVKNDPIFKYFEDGEYVYYVHSFYARNCATSTLGTSQYGNVAVTGVVRNGNVWGTQFHPEKSGDTGLRLLKAFAEL